MAARERTGVYVTSERQRALTQRFEALHASGTFVIPNPWDLGSARLLVSLGFQALATTSSGFAWSTGRPDNHITLDDALSAPAHDGRLVSRSR